MPSPDPIPGKQTTTLRQRFWRVFRLLALFSAVIGAIAVALVARGQDEVRIHMLIATGVGIALTVLVGTALMTLTFLSASSGHDDKAGEARGAAEKDRDD